MTTRPLKILVIRLSAWGDVILTLDVVRRLVSVPGNEVHVLTKQKFSAVYRQEAGLQVHEVPDEASLRELHDVIGKLREEDFDYVIDLHSNLRSRLICVLLMRTVLRIQKPRLRETLLFTLRGIGCLLYRRPYSRALVAIALVSPSSALSPSRRDDSTPGCWVALCGETAWSTKQWPQERFLEVARRLKARDSAVKVVWLGLNQQQRLGADVCDEDARGVADLQKLRTLLGRCQLLLCNDTGMMHLAEDQGVPVAAIFGPTTIELGFGPRLPQSRIIERKLWCRPCSKNGSRCHRVIQKQACLKSVSVDDVERIVTEMLTKPRSHGSLTAL